MVSAIVYAFVAGIALPLAIGWPIAVLLGFRSGLRSLGMAAACGLSFVLILCRGVQMVSAIAPASPWMLLVYVSAVLVLWTRLAVCRDIRAICRHLASQVVSIAVTIGAIAVLLNVPILFGHAVEFEGSSNADSFTFTSSARYMLQHAFFGSPDFSPVHPVYTISRGYFGEGAMQPRPAAEGFLAWLSAMASLDPMYLYNGLQTAGVALAGLSMFAFSPEASRDRSLAKWLVTLVITFACPVLLHLAINSNFANGLNLAAATAYVAIGCVGRTRRTFLAAVLLLGCLLSGYPELLVFVGACRFFGAAFLALQRRSLRVAVLEASWLVGEVATACLLLPWAALGAFAVYHTTLGVSQVGASDLAGNMYAGMPLFAVAAIAFSLAWRAFAGDQDAARSRLALLGILVTFAFAQLAMIARGFSYGGFKISEYFVTLLSATLLLSIQRLLDTETAPARRTTPTWLPIAFTAIVALAMVGRSADMVRRSWRVADLRQVTPDLISMGQFMNRVAVGRPIALGSTPRPFYYSMWVAYTTDAPIAYDLADDPDAAGYLSGYLRSQETQAYRTAPLTLSLDPPGQRNSRHEGDIAVFGPYHLATRTDAL